jgi:hypothetical protein
MGKGLHDTKKFLRAVGGSKRHTGGGKFANEEAGDTIHYKWVKLGIGGARRVSVSRDWSRSK